MLKKIFLILNAILITISSCYALTFVSCDTHFSSPIVNITDKNDNTQFLFDDDGDILLYKQLSNIIFGESNKKYYSFKNNTNSLNRAGILYKNTNEQKTILFGKNQRIYTKNILVKNNVQANCPSDGWFNHNYNPYGSEPLGYYCRDSINKEERDYFCSIFNNPQEGVCQYKSLDTYNCLNMQTYDSDGGDAPKIAGYVKDYDSCNLSGCTGPIYYDKRTSENDNCETIREYYPTGITHDSRIVNCNTEFGERYYCNGLTSWQDSKWEVKDIMTTSHCTQDEINSGDCNPRVLMSYCSDKNTKKYDKDPKNCQEFFDNNFAGKSCYGQYYIKDYASASCRELDTNSASISSRCWPSGLKYCGKSCEKWVCESKDEEGKCTDWTCEIMNRCTSTGCKTYYNN